MAKEETTPTLESKYIQQHLANERTFLAWIRSAVAMIGLGYLAGKLHFLLSVLPDHHSDFYARSIGAISISCGLATIVLATINYFRKRKAINRQTFIATIAPVWVFSIGSILISVLFLLYLLYL